MAFSSATDRVVLAAIQSTRGTAATMNAATAILAMNASVRTIADQLARCVNAEVALHIRVSRHRTRNNKACSLDIPIDDPGLTDHGIAGDIEAAIHAAIHPDIAAAADLPCNAGIAANDRLDIIRVHRVIDTLSHTVKHSAPLFSTVPRKGAA